MKKILIIDKDESTVSMLSNELKAHGEIEIRVAKNIDTGIGHLEKDGADLLVCELNMPEFEGYKLLAIANKNFSDMPVIVMTGKNSPQTKAKVNAFGVSCLFEKPLDLETVTRKILGLLDVEDKEMIKGIGLAAFLQMVELEGKTCTLTVQSGKKSGHIYAREGELIAAETPPYKGTDALYRILAWEDAMIRVEGVCKKKYREIDMPLMHLLMEGHRKQDDRELVEEEPKPRETVENAIFPASSGKDEKTDDLFVDAPVEKADEEQELENILESNLGVYEYKIFDRTGNLLERSGRQDSLLKMSPAGFLATGEKLAKFFNSGKLEYVVMNSKSGVRCSIFRHEEKLVAALLGVGLKTTDLLKTVKKKANRT